MKFNHIKIILIAFIPLSLTFCTSDFEEFNTDPYGVTDEELEQDFNNIGEYFPAMLRMLVNTEPSRYQTGQNLTTDSWAGYFGTPTDFSGNANNTNYKIVWDDIAWDDTYDDIMAPSKNVIELARENEEPQFVAWAKLVRIYGLQKVASLHGPVIYSHYGENSTTAEYDSEEELYKTFFQDLDTVNATLKDYKDFDGFQDFDKSSFKGDVSKWLKLSNSLRLMLALRLSDVAPKLAQKQAEKATNQDEGLFESNDDNFNIDLGADNHPIYTIGYDYNDTRMSATMESFLVGFQDPRLKEYFTPVNQDDVDELVADHPDFPYKGVKNGAKINDKEKRTPYSKPGAYFENTSNTPLLTMADVDFMLAEAKLRGWNVGPQSVKGYYEDGIQASFEQWGATGIEDYLTDDEHTPIDYTDPAANSSDVNAFNAQTDITIQWDESDSQEHKLERILSQKWIAGFPNSFSAWVDFRRTGYPAIEPIYHNKSGSSDGIIPDGDYIKRMRFTREEYHENKESVENAVEFLDGPDEIGTRLWWDVDEPNF